MAPIGYADGLLKPANQVRAQKDLVKQVPGSNLPKQPIRTKRVTQSIRDLAAAEHVKREQQAYLPPNTVPGPIREVQAMKGLSGINRDIDFDKAFRTREQIGKMVSQANELRKGRTHAELMTEAEQLAHTVRHNPQMRQDLRRDQIDKRRHAITDLVRTNYQPKRHLDMPGDGAPGAPPAAPARGPRGNPFTTPRHRRPRHGGGGSPGGGPTPDRVPRPRAARSPPGSGGGSAASAPASARGTRATIDLRDERDARGRGRGGRS